jgi:hypothetical protein
MHLYIASMPIVPLFLLKLSVSLAVVWSFYQVMLRRLTFHGLNRWYLLGYTMGVTAETAAERATDRG